MQNTEVSVYFWFHFAVLDSWKEPLRAPWAAPDSPSLSHCLSSLASCTLVFLSRARSLVQSEVTQTDPLTNCDVSHLMDECLIRRYKHTHVISALLYSAEISWCSLVDLSTFLYQRRYMMKEQVKCKKKRGKMKQRSDSTCFVLEYIISAVIKNTSGVGDVHK